MRSSLATQYRGKPDPAHRAARRQAASKPKSVPKLSQNEQAYRRIRQEIITLRLAPGEYINEFAIGASMSFGRTPVHHALHRLMHEGLVQIVPRKGVIVQPLSLEEAGELIAVRALNEPYAAALAAERITEAELDRMDALLRSAREIREGDLDSFIAVDEQFHASIAAAARNRVLATLLFTVHQRSMRFWAITLTFRPRVPEMMSEHKALLARLRAHDVPGARKAMKAHIDAFRASISLRLR